MAKPDSNDSVAFGQDEALFVYNMARSVDSPARPDETIATLARDAVRTAIRFRYEGDLPFEHIDENLAVIGLIAALEGSVEVYSGKTNGQA